MKKNWIIGAGLVVALFSGTSSVFASESLKIVDDSITIQDEAQFENRLEESVIYRCTASGRTRRETWVQGEAEASGLEWAERWALRNCAQKGGINCKIQHCFREGAGEEQ